MAGYNSVKIGVSGSTKDVLEGSINVSINEPTITYLKYEGGTIAPGGTKVSGDATVTLEWKTEGGGSLDVPTENSTVGVYVDGSSSAAFSVTGKHITSPGWDSNWGPITQHKITGTTT